MNTTQRKADSTPAGIYECGGKRAFDIIVATTALAGLSPVLMIIALMTLGVDPGPVLFRQTRVGKHGRTFTFYKFRSMPVGTRNVCSDQLGAIKLTWWGRLLRRSNLDELPQLFNILKGDMSIVGPRPPLPTQEELIRLRAANGALTCRPGLTGLAQVSSFDGMPVAEKAKFDGLYAAAVSLRLDLTIIVRTFGYLAKPPPVY